MTLILSSLPPPSIFTHDETLHRIILPPLASFLSSLHLPEHIVKLKDILDRYRTPKSYHRIDVREVDSSEVPFDEPDARFAAAERERLRRGRTPLVMPPDEELEAYLSQELKVRRSPQGLLPGNGTLDEGGNAEAGPSRSPPLVPVPSAEPMDVTLPSPRPVSSVKASALPLEADPAQRLSPTQRSQRIVSLPPTGPRRRVRELRLDLRTLDAAALFALETWRRQVQGLEKLEMEHPDSVWYKAPTPTPPLPTPPVNVPRKRGRPRKIRPEEHTAANTNMVGEKNGDAAEITADMDGPQGLGIDPQTNGGDKAGADMPIDTQSGDNPHRAADGTPTGSANAMAGALSDPRSPSPDVVLHDAYNEKEEADPDFVPPAHLRPRRGTRRPRKSALLSAADTSEEALELPARISALSPSRQPRALETPDGVGGPRNTGAFRTASSAADRLRGSDAGRAVIDPSTLPTPRTARSRARQSASVDVKPDLQTASASRSPSKRAKSAAVTPREPSKRGWWGPIVDIPTWSRSRHVSSSAQAMEVDLPDNAGASEDGPIRTRQKKRRPRRSWATGNIKRRRRRTTISVVVDAGAGGRGAHPEPADDEDGSMELDDDHGEHGDRAQAERGHAASTGDGEAVQDESQESGQGGSGRDGSEGSGAASAGEWDFLKALS